MTLSSQLLTAPLLDHRGLDLDAAGRITYVLEQSFRYDYDAPVESLRQRLVVVPPSRHGSQQAIFMNHASGAVAPPDVEVVQVGDAIWQRAKRGGLVQGAVWPVRVVEVLVLAQGRSSGGAGSR